MERAPWICPACGVGCAPHVDYCGACVMKAAMKPLDEAMKYTPPAPPPSFEPFPVTPFPWSPGMPITGITLTGTAAERCALADYFRAHPEATSVNMVCFCPRCTPRYSVSGGSPAGREPANKITITLTSTAAAAAIESAFANHVGTWVTDNGAAMAARGIS